MLRTGFVGSDNFFDRYLCEWLREHSDLRLIVWTDQLRWAAKPRRWRKAALRYRRRARRYGWARAVDEIIYYAIYRTFLRQGDTRQLRSLIDQMAVDEIPGGGLEDIPQIRPADIQAKEVLDAIIGGQLDALFAVCVDVLLPTDVI